MKKFDTIESNEFASNPYWKYIKDKYILPDGKIGDYHFVRTLGSTMIIPIFNDKLLLSRQYRYINKRFSLEFPGGGIAKEISSIENAHKELEEELGYKANFMEKIASFNPFNGICDEFCDVYVAKDLEFVTKKLDDSEEIETLELNIQDINDRIYSNEIWDGMTAASFQYFQYTHFYRELLCK